MPGPDLCSGFTHYPQGPCLSKSYKKIKTVISDTLSAMIIRCSKVTGSYGGDG